MFASTSPELNLSPPVSDNSPTVPTHTHAVEPSSRSCVTCRRRKVRCNKRSPCSNCTKAGIDCVFPPPGRAPRKSKRPPDAELLSRLRRLEGVIDHLRNSGHTEGSSTSTRGSISGGHESGRSDTGTSRSDAETQPKSQDGGGCPFEDSDPKKLAPNKFENEFGRLVIDEGRSRYVSNRLWASLGDEVGWFGLIVAGFVADSCRSRNYRIFSIIRIPRKRICLLRILPIQAPMMGSSSGSIHFPGLFGNFTLPCLKYQCFGKSMKKMLLL
jgi:hypothetical protein